MSNEKLGAEQGRRARVTTEMIQRAVGKFGADIPWCKAVAEKLNAQMGISEPKPNADDFIDNWIGWIPVNDRLAFALQIRQLSSREKFLTEAPQEPK